MYAGNDLEERYWIKTVMFVISNFSNQVRLAFCLKRPLWDINGIMESQRKNQTVMKKNDIEKFMSWNLQKRSMFMVIDD